MKEPCDHYDIQNYDRFDICEKCGMRWYANITIEEAIQEIEESNEWDAD